MASPFRLSPTLTSTALISSISRPLCTMDDQVAATSAQCHKVLQYFTLTLLDPFLSSGCLIHLLHQWGSTYHPSSYCTCAQFRIQGINLAPEWSSHSAVERNVGLINNLLTRIGWIWNIFPLMTLKFFLTTIISFSFFDLWPNSWLGS